jgi:hypothetical protein
MPVRATTSGTTLERSAPAPKVARRKRLRLDFERRRSGKAPAFEKLENAVGGGSLILLLHPHHSNHLALIFHDGKPVGIRTRLRETVAAPAGVTAAAQLLLAGFRRDKGLGAGGALAPIRIAKRQAALGLGKHLRDEPRTGHLRLYPNRLELPWRVAWKF